MSSTGRDPSSVDSNDSDLPEDPTVRSRSGSGSTAPGDDPARETVPQRDSEPSGSASASSDAETPGNEASAAAAPESEDSTERVDPYQTPTGAGRQHDSADGGPEEAKPSSGDGISETRDAAPAELAEHQTVISKPAPAADSKSGPATPAEVATVLLGKQLGHFVLDQLIGGGGMGAVFGARDTRLGRTVAVKVIPNVGEDPDLQRRFRNEAQSAARLDHPNIARVYDVGRQGGWHFIVFEYIEGVNLRDSVARNGLLSVDDAVFYTRQVAEALHHASRRGVVHRDVKPSNVLVTREGDIKLVDMGLARTHQLDVTEDQTASGVTLGTFDYISPEQARDPRDADVRSDLYSLGCTLFYMLTGRPPYPGGTMLQKLLNHGATPPPDPRETRPEVSESLTLILHKLLQKKPEDRYQSPLELIADLQELALREELPRAGSMGTVVIAPSPAWIGVAEHLIPWTVALLVLFISVLWLETAGNTDLVIPSPAPRPQPAVAEGPPAPSTSPAPTVPTDEVTGESSSESVPSSPADGPSVVSRPPVVREVTREESTESAQPLPPQPPRTLVVASSTAAAGKWAEDPTARVVSSLASALREAEREETVDFIQLAERHISTGPITIPRDDLSIMGHPDGTVIQFVPGTIVAMERPRMLRLDSTQVVFSNVHFVWSIKSDFYEGGTLLSFRGGESLRLVDSSITIENVRETDRVFAMEFGAGSSLAPRSSTDSQLPTIGVEMENVIVRGQMTLFNMEQMALLDLVWNNGLLAVSRYMLETVGAIRRPPGGYDKIELELNSVTAYGQEGLVRIRLGPSGAEPIFLRRTSVDCLYISNHPQPLVSISQLPEMEMIDQILSLNGENNAYQWADQLTRAVDSRSFPVLQATTTDDEMQEWGIAEIQQQRSLNWFDERSIEPNVVLDSGIWPPDSPLHAQTPRDFKLEGLLVPGFVFDALPEIPSPKPVPSI